MIICPTAKLALILCVALDKKFEERPMRRFKQQIVDSNCEEILKNEKRGVLSLLGDNGYPYGLPMSHFYRKEGEWALNINSVIVFGKIRLVTDLELEIEHMTGKLVNES